MDNLFDVVVVGGGPAGLTAALYLARAKYRVLVVEKEQFGGQITITSEVVNFPGVYKTSGKELTETMRKQAESFGAEFMLAEVKGFDLTRKIRKITTSRGEIQCFGILLATGAHPRKIGFDGEDKFKGHGVAYCATCDGEFFAGKEVFVIGGGFAAAEESVFLTRYAKHVTVLVRGEDFSCAKSTADAAKNHEKITVVTNSSVVSVEGDTALRILKYKNNKTGEMTEYRAEEGDTFGVFVFAGYEPETELVKDFVKLNEQGYVETDEQQKTNIDGLYAAGDVCVKNLRQVVTAVGDGALAATELERYASKIQKTTGLKPQIKEVVRQENPEKEHEGANQSANSLFDTDMTAQLKTVFSKMEHPLLLKLYLDSKPLSEELKNYVEAMTGLTDKLSVEIAESHTESETPCVRVFREEQSDTGLAFHGVPGGHEFTSFVLGLYNAAGEGQTVNDSVKERITKINQEVHMQILVSLSCTMCPELVTAAQKIAALNPFVAAEVYDINLFGDKKQKYNVMSVPCLVINEDKVFFGKKNIEQILDLI
ncbi:MAG: FAD-dependent oxidoreductase [Clostridiales bacterium]|nr:FAD-dependent oxidoreductase [Clostridiales bacterium]